MSMKDTPQHKKAALSLTSNTTNKTEPSNIIKQKKKRVLVRRSKIELQKLTLKAYDLVKQGDSVRQMAMKLRLPRQTLYDLISSDERWDAYKKSKKAVLDAKYAELAEKSALEATKRLKNPEGIKYKDLVIGSAIAHDKAYPQPTALSQFNIGDKKVDIQWAGWDNKPIEDKK